MPASFLVIATLGGIAASSSHVTSLQLVPCSNSCPAINKYSAIEGYERLLEFDEKWGAKYPLTSRSWQQNWDNLSTFFEYDGDVRRVIYTTNPIEGMHRQVRKITKTKGAFTSEQALLKLLYLVIREITKKWTLPIENWGLPISQLYIKFGDRLRLGNDSV